MFLLLFISCENKSNFKFNKEQKKNDSTLYFKTKLESNDIDYNQQVLLNRKLFKCIIKNKNNSKNRELAYIVISNMYNLNIWKDYKDASVYLLKASQKAKDSLSIANSYRCLGNYFLHETIYDSSLYYYIKAEKYYFNIKDYKNYSTIIFKKGKLQYSARDFIASDLSLSKALILSKKENDVPKTCAILNQLGLVNIQLQDYYKSIDYFNKALKLIRDKKISTSENEESVCLSNLGLVYTELKEYKKALYYYELSLKPKNIEQEAPILYSNIIDNIGISKFELNDYKEVKSYLFKSLRIRQRLELNSEIVTSYNNLSQFYQKIGDNEKSITYAKKSYEYAIKKNLKADQILSLNQLSLVDKKNSFIYAEKYGKLRDSLQTVERKSRDRFARIQLETDEIIKEKDDLEGKSKNYFYLIIGLVVFGGGFFVIRNQITRTKILQYKQAQQAANEEIFNLMMSQQSEIDATRSKEKRKISRDLHDGVLGRLFGARLSLESLNTLEDEDSVTMRHNYIEELKKIEQDIREISHDLNREKLEVVNNFVAIVTALVEEQNKNHSANTTLTIDPTINWNTINSIKKINTYRIIQEALQNCNKYAQADTIFVTIAKENTHYKISVKDNGVGYDVNKKGKGIGTKNMIERTEECKGIFEVNSKFGEGSEVIVMMPLDDEQPKPNQTV